jgi:hypothetical protein
MFDTIGRVGKFDEGSAFDGDRYVPSGFPPFHHYSKEFVRENNDLVNDQSREAVVAKLYARLSPHVVQGGSFSLHELLVDDNGRVVLITGRGLMDDAISAEQIMLFFDTSMNGRNRLMNVGVRRKCGRQGDSQAWTIGRC